jgi:hypothetical protein
MNASMPRRPERRDSASRVQLLNRVRAEFHEMPCLRLTCRQAQRLFGMRADVCERVFAAVIGEGTLTCGPDARYRVRADVALRGSVANTPIAERRTSILEKRSFPAEEDGREIARELVHH